MSAMLLGMKTNLRAKARILGLPKPEAEASGYLFVPALSLGKKTVFILDICPNDDWSRRRLVPATISPGDDQVPQAFRLGSHYLR